MKEKNIKAKAKSKRKLIYKILLALFLVLMLLFIILLDVFIYPINKFWLKIFTKEYFWQDQKILCVYILLMSDKAIA